MAVASLVLGILSICCSFLSASGMGILGTIFAILGIIFGAIGRKEPGKQGMATAGVVCSVIGLFLNVILFIACVACVGGLAALGLGAASL